MECKLHAIAGCIQNNLYYYVLQFIFGGNHMRIAAIYDIHGNVPALEAVLGDIKAKDVDLIVVGGDVVAGPFPVETLNLLQGITSPTQFILGNSESDVLRCIEGKPINALSKRAEEVARWITLQLSTSQKIFLSTWTPTTKIATDKWGEILFCHGTPRSNTEIFTQRTSHKNLSSIFESISSSLVVCGHTHMQFDIHFNNKRIVNAGSVGMPFGETGADWLSIDDEIHLMHTDYDTDEAARRIKQSDYPGVEDFVSNNVLASPCKETKLEVLSWMEENQLHTV